jgi:hypothetical protein
LNRPWKLRIFVINFKQVIVQLSFLKRAVADHAAVIITFLGIRGHTDAVVKVFFVVSAAYRAAVVACAIIPIAYNESLPLLLWLLLPALLSRVCCLYSYPILLLSILGHTFFYI